MRQGFTHEIEVAEDVGGKGALQLFVGDFGDVVPVVLLGSVVDEDVEAAQLPARALDRFTTERGVGHVALEQQAALAFGFDQRLGVFRVAILIEIDHGTIGPFAGVVHRYGTADTAVAAGDQRHLALELVGAAIVVANELRLGPHIMLVARLICLMLWGKMRF